ncbi:hypothetical protein KP509_26G071900 [Ceratopteris richardii]|uniref:Uncharacterized protein n=1 Tax=Ceratopteris richardii TaxID=49495 RepID=A0A8T2RM54_CERRI|nr:hypothetical protein KP509_26G071900 [Ceratopteris richardii]
MVFLNSSREQPSLPFTYPSWEATPSSSSSSSTSVLTTSTFSVSSSTSPLLSCPSGVSNSACLLQKQRQMRHLIAEKLPSPELPFASFVHSGHSRELRGRTGPEILSDFGFKSLFSQALEETTEGEEEERVIKGKKKQKGSRTYKSFHLKIGNASARRLFSGAFAGAVSRTAVAPLETIRTHLMVGSSGLNVHDVFKHIMQEEGWQGLFRGNGVNVIRVAPSKAIELFAYDTIKKGLDKKVLGQFHIPIPTSSIAGAAAGVCSTICTYPLELLKTRLTIQAGVLTLKLFTIRIFWLAKLKRSKKVTWRAGGGVEKVLGGCADILMVHTITGKSY